MSTTTTKGYKKPSTGDRNYFGDLEWNIDRVNSHLHDGTDSEQISSKNILKLAVDITAVGWTATAGQPGTYQQEITLPAGHSMDSITPRFYGTTGEWNNIELLLTILRLTSTTFRVFANDNTLTLKVVYG